MVPEKKPIDSVEETQLSEQTLEQTSTETIEADIAPTEEIFDAPTVLTETNGMLSEKQKAARPLSKRRFRTIISLLVAILILVGGCIGVTFIPENEEEQSTTNNTILVKKTDTANIEKIVVNGSYGKMVFASKKATSEETSSNAGAVYTWELQGFDKELIASSSVNAAADNLATIYATRIMEQDQSQREVYGLNKPAVTAEVFVREGENYTLTVGEASPDGSGYYACITGDPRIFLISAGTVNNFNQSAEEMANTVILTAPTVEDVVKKTDKKYFDDETGALSTFESIELSGPKYGKKVVITPIVDNEFVKYSIDLGEYSRYADPDVVEEMFSLMTNGLVAIDTYVLEPTAAEIKKYGLDAPELFIKIKYGEMSTNLKATLYDKENQYYAVMIDDRNAIYAVTADALAMLQYGVEDYYYQFVFQEFIYKFKNMTVETPEKTYSFDIKHDSSNDTFTATSYGKKVDEDLVSAYYQYFLTLAPELKDSYTDGKADIKATFTYKNTSKGQVVVELIKQSARRYLVRIDGNDLGIVNSSDYDHLIVYAEYVMTDKGIPEP